MTLSRKLELLGHVSERARELEDPSRPLAHVEIDVMEAMYVIRLTRSDEIPWTNQREQLVDLLAVAVNWILAGDAAARRGNEVRGLVEDDDEVTA